MAEINNDEKRIGVSGEQIEEAVGKVPIIEADVKANKQNISALQTASAQHTADIAKNTADIALKANADEVYSKDEADSAITAKVAEIVAGAPEEFDTLKEMSDWLTEHSDSAAEMNTAIQTNTKAIADNATAIEANTAEIANNKSDILKIARSTSVVRIGAVGWYRIAEIDKLLTRRSMFLRILRGYSNIKPEAHLLYLNFAYGGSEKDPMTFSDCNIIDAFCYDTKIDKIRIVMPSKVGESSTFYIDIHYNANTSESVSAEIFGESAPGSNVNPVNLINLTKIDTLPDDCLTKEYTLGNRDIFDRLTALETVLAQIQTE